ncbi:MAG TPA: DUF368 domain-containing protein [Salinimicrobium sp.]|nr:DUF368 domain-containing protein [Salinimicrobium sp.]
MRRSFKEYFFVTLKGMAMGAADVVPGVSGGTIAFISGIYMELINTIDKLDIGIIGTARAKGIKFAWKEYNLPFLLALLLGIAISILTFARVISFLLENKPIIIWSFFFGLVIASIVYIVGQITKWTWKSILALVVGIVISYYVTIAEPVSSPDSYWFLFLSGFIAIIAMILPGISGAFILLLMGSYHAVIASINQFTTGIFDLNWNQVFAAASKLAVFAVGAILGIKLFSKVLTWMFDNYKNFTLAILTGFMVGSLNKIWPWKETLTTYINSHNEEVPVLQKSVFPGEFSGDPEILNAIIFSILGFLTIFLLEKLAVRKKGKI